MSNLFSKKLSVIMKSIVVVLSLVMVLILLLSINRTYGKYIFANGSSDWIATNGVVTPAVLAKFANRGPIITNMLWGVETNVKIEIFMAGIALIGSIFQLTRWFKGFYNNFVSSMVISIASLLSFVIAANPAILAIGVILLLTSAFAVVESTFVTFFKLEIQHEIKTK